MTDDQEKTPEEALKPCPFCGGRARFIHNYAGDCGAQCDCGARVAWGCSEKEIAEVWNRREEQEEQNDCSRCLRQGCAHRQENIIRINCPLKMRSAV